MVVGLRKSVDVRACENESKEDRETSKESYAGLIYARSAETHDFRENGLQFLDGFRELIVGKEREQTAHVRGNT